MVRMVIYSCHEIIEHNWGKLETLWEQLALLRDPGGSQITEAIPTDFARGLHKKFALQHYPIRHP